MKKIVINTCFGGYGWSMKAVHAILLRKSYRLKYMVTTIYTKEYKEEDIEVSKYNFFQILDELAKNNRYCGPNNNYVSGIHLEDDQGRVWTGHSIDREDPDAIAVLEELGSEFCSSNHARLKIEEYDEDLFDYSIDEYDGDECLDLIPRLTEKRIRACANVDEIVDLLRKMNLFQPPF